MKKQQGEKTAKYRTGQDRTGTRTRLVPLPNSLTDWSPVTKPTMSLEKEEEEEEEEKEEEEEDVYEEEVEEEAARGKNHEGHDRTGQGG